MLGLLQRKPRLIKQIWAEVHGRQWVGTGRVAEKLTGDGATAAADIEHAVARPQCERIEQTGAHLPPVGEGRALFQ